MSVTALRKQFEDIKRAHDSVNDWHIAVHGCSFMMMQSGLYYKPSVTGYKFHKSPDFVRAIMGPVGSGKSTANCAEIVLKTVGAPRCIDGVRRARWAIIRNTYGELETTTLATWNMWFADLGQTHLRMKTPIRYMASFNDGKGVIELEVYFLALDRPEDVKKLESLELTGVFINEARNIPEIVIERCQERVGRFPNTGLCPTPFWHGVILDTNPPDSESWFYKKFEVLKPKGYFIVKQPPGLIKQDDGSYLTNIDAENIANLPRDYYLNAIIGRTEEHINVQVMGNYGYFIDGRPVYSAYNDDIHAANGVDFIPGVPVVIGWDFGLTPSAIFCQLAPGGRLLAIKELCSEDMGLEGFITNHIDPFIATTLAGYTIESVADPSGNRRGDTDERSCFDVLNLKGFKVEAATSNALTPRIDAVNHFLTRLIDGHAAFQVSKTGCPRLRKGFLGSYHLKRVRGTHDKFHDMPDKNEFSHTHDCQQYVALHFRKEVTKPKATFKPHVIANYGGLV